MFFFKVFDLPFLTSELSVTSLIGLLDGFILVIIIFGLSLTIFPLYLRSLKALIGEMDSYFKYKLKIVSYTYKLYPMVLAGVETNTPPETNFFNLY